MRASRCRLHGIGRLGEKTVFLIATADGHFEQAEIGTVPTVVQENVASMIATIGPPARPSVDEPTQSVWLLGAVCSETAVHGVIAINIGRGSHEVINVKTRRVEIVLE